MSTFNRRLACVALAVAALAASTGALAQQASQTQQTPEGRVYAPGPFDRLEVDGSGQIRLVQGDRDEVFVAGDQATQDSVSIRLSGSRLKIDLPGGWKFWNGSKAQVEVRMRNLSHITLSGAGDVIAPGPIRSPMLSVSIAGAGTARFDDLNADALRFDISGAGEGQLTGQVQSMSLSVSGKGKVTADQLRTGTASVSISGVANAELWVIDTLRVDISGAGHVGYWGQPKVRQSISGLGSVDPRGEKR